MAGRMDFPNNVVTNVYRIVSLRSSHGYTFAYDRQDDVKEIYWECHSLESETKTAGENPSRPYIDQPGWSAGDSLQDIDIQLRQQGVYVFREDHRSRLWLFYLSKEQKARAEPILNSQGLERMQCIILWDCLLIKIQGTFLGSIRSSDLIASSGSGSAAKSKTVTATVPKRQPARDTAVASASVNRGSHVIPGLIHVMDPAEPAEVATSSEEIPVQNLYSKLLAALSSTLAMALSQEAGYLLIGSRMCIHQRTAGHISLDQFGFGGFAENTCLTSCNARWLSSGTLCLTFVAQITPQLSSLRHAFHNDRNPSTLTPGIALLLSPSGLIGHYHSLEHTPHGHSSANVRLKAKSSISDRLASRGIVIPRDAPWLWISPKGAPHQTTGSQNPKHSHKSELILWPVALCFCHISGPPAFAREEHFLAEADLDGVEGPLERAQAWFLGKDERKRASELKQREANAELERMKESEAQEDDESVSRAHVNQSITPGDMSGVYPTPPDGMPTTIPDPSIGDSAQYGNAAEDTDLTKNTIKEDSSGPHGNRENDDLFGDIDIDMFTTTGLTEADFSFFDEPDIPGQSEPTNADPEWETEVFSLTEHSNNIMQSVPEQKEGEIEQKEDRPELPSQAMEAQQESGKPMLSPVQQTLMVISYSNSRRFTRRYHDDRSAIKP